MNLISTDNASTFVGGVSATTADLFNINWNDKPTVGFTSQTHRFCYNIGNLQAYKSGYPHTFGIATTGDAICLAPNSSTAVPTGSGCLYVVSDTSSKLLFNTNTPYTGTFGTAPITFANGGNMYIKTSNAFNDGSVNFDMAMYLESSNATAPIGFAFQLNNAVNTTSTNAAYMGTTTANDLRLMTNNGTKATLTSAGRFGIGTSTPAAILDVSGSVSTTIDAAGTGVAYFLKSGGLISTIGPLSSISVSIRASSAILVGAGVYTTSDKRLKKDITSLDCSMGDCIMKIDPVQYRYKNQDANVPVQIGYIAQDCIKAGLSSVVNFNDRDGLAVEDKTVDIANVQYSIDYSKVCVLLHVALKNQAKTITQVESQSNDLRLCLQSAQQLITKQQATIDELNTKIASLFSEFDNLQNAKSYADWCRNRKK